VVLSGAGFEVMEAGRACPCDMRKEALIIGSSHPLV